MNLAFSALLIFSLLLPGLIFLRAYQNGFNSWVSPDGGDSLGRDIAGALIISAVFHLAWIGLAAKLGYTIDFESALVFLTGYSEEKSGLFTKAIETAARSGQRIALYFLTLYFAAAALGFFVNWLVVRYNLDGHVPPLRFSNHWSYLLSGRLSGFSELQQDFDGQPVSGVFAAAVVKHEEGSYLYRGLIVDWVCRSNGDLDRIIIEVTRRRKLDNDRKYRRVRDPFDYHLSADRRYYPIQGNYFTIRYSDMITLNIEYVFVDLTGLAPPRYPSAGH